MNVSENASAIPAAVPRRYSRDAIATAIASFGLAAITVLAFLPAATAAPADKLTLLFLAIVAFICFWTPLLRLFDAHSGAAAFVLTAAMFVIYSLARNSGPEDGFALRFKALPDDTFPISYAARIALLCAMITIPAWWRKLNGWTKSLFTGAFLLIILGTSIFVFLSGRYVVGVTEQLDPTPLPTFGMQIVEYSAVALLCTVVTAQPAARRVALRVLPFALLALWARHQFMAAPVSEEAE